MKERIIYALKCPISKSVHYIGKSTIGLTRPFAHLRYSHNQKIREWVNDLELINYKPEVSVLEYVNHEVDIDEREKYWINQHLNNGSYLLNSVLISPAIINPNIHYSLTDIKVRDIEVIAQSIKKRRKDIGLSQKELSEKAGIALTVIRKIEQGKENFTFESLVSVLLLLGLTISIKRI